MDFKKFIVGVLVCTEQRTLLCMVAKANEEELSRIMSFATCVLFSSSNNNIDIYLNSSEMTLTLNSEGRGDINIIRSVGTQCRTNELNFKELFIRTRVGCFSPLNLITPKPSTRKKKHNITRRIHVQYIRQVLIRLHKTASRDSRRIRWARF